MGGMLISAANLAGCGQLKQENKESDISKTDPSTAYTEETTKDAEPGTVNAGTISDNDNRFAKNENSDGNAPPPPEQSQVKIPTKIIKTADISYQVEKFDASRNVILSIVQKSGARVSSENQTNDGYRITNTMVIRTEATEFDSIVDALMSESIYVDRKIINAQDVTEEYVDLTARLKSKKEVESQYAEILKKARSINEILEVQDYLGRIREEIESFEGRLKYMEDRATYSTITLQFYENLDNVSKQPDRSFGSRMGEALSWGWNGLVNFFLGIIYLWPLWLILGFITWLVFFLVKRSRRRSKAAKEVLTSNTK